MLLSVVGGVRNERKKVGMKRTIALVFAAGVLVASASTAGATITHSLNVDGVTYSPTKVVGNTNDPTVHYETPDTNPGAAFSERHTWAGNGSENLPCPYGIHWIDNANVLTISHCLEGPSDTTTTTTSPTTTTSSPETTTTTEPTTTTTVPQETTTTTNPPSTTITTVVVTSTTTSSPTTTEPTTTTSEVVSTTTPTDPCVDSNGDGIYTVDADGDGVEDDVNGTPCELPFTGASGLWPFAIAGFTLSALGLGALALAAERQ